MATRGPLALHEPELVELELVAGQLLNRLNWEQHLEERRLLQLGDEAEVSSCITIDLA